MRILDRKFRKHILKYILQCLAATLTIITILLFLDTLKTTAIIAALGASTLIAFTTPNSYLARPRPIIGGYLIGITTGIVASFLAHNPTILNYIGSQEITTTIFGGLSVGLAIFLMSITSTEHAPASGVALGLVINSWEMSTIFFIFGAVAFLVLIRQLLRPYLLDLREI